MNRNAALCYLMGVTGASLVNVFDSVPEDDDQVLLLALGCARAGRFDRFAAMLDILDERDIGLVSSYVLMLGLSGQLQRALLLFDVLKRRMPCEAVIWLAQARLQAAWDYPVQALRSDAMYRQLANRSPADGPPLTIEVVRSEPGQIHFLEGDVEAFRRQ